MANISAIQLPDGNTYNIKDDSSGYITGMTILSYGNSTWQDFLDAYNANKVVYCRASSNSNPASGSQTRLAFMAYVNNATNPTNVEFQYYRSVSAHTASQQGDQVYVYKLDKTAGWSVTVREASVKVVAGTGLGGTYSNGTMTLTGPTISLNGSSTTSASFYAPTDAGTSGQVLTSNGSGAPTWAAQNEDIFVAEYNLQTETGTPFNDIKAAYEAGKFVILDAETPFSHVFLPLVALIDELTSDQPSATVGFTASENSGDFGSLMSIVCTVEPDPTDTSQLIEEWEMYTFEVQPELESGTNIKTINNQSILGSGNLTITSGTQVQIIRWTES